MKPALQWGMLVLLLLSFGACSGNEPSPVAEKSENGKGNDESVGDLVTSGDRFSLGPDGVITDAQTGLEWVCGPDRDTTYAEAEQWVAACNAGGGGWRMPTRQELRSLYIHEHGERNLNTAFKTTGWWVWAEPRDSSSAWTFLFSGGDEDWHDRNAAYYGRAFGVRSRPRG